MTPERSGRPSARTGSDRRSRVDAAEQWIEWQDYDCEAEWAASALLALEALARLAPPPPAQRMTR